MYFSGQEYWDRHFISQHFFTKLQDPSTFTSWLPSWQSDACSGCVSSQTSYSSETWGRILIMKTTGQTAPTSHCPYLPFMLMCFLSEGFFRPFLWSLRDWLWAVWFLDLAMVGGSQDLWNKRRWSSQVFPPGASRQWSQWQYFCSISMFQTDVGWGKQEDRLELDHLSLALLLSTELEVLGPLDGTLKQGRMLGTADIRGGTINI